MIGRPLRFDAGTCTVIGVLPLDGIFNRAAADVYLVHRFAPDAATQNGRVLTALGRLAPGVSIDRAGVELAGIADTFNATRGPAGRGWTTQLTPLRQVLVRVDMRRLAWILMAAVGCVLLVASVNVAGLSLSRTLDRRRKVAVRAALGATRARLFRGLIVEGLLLAAARPVTSDSAIVTASTCASSDAPAAMDERIDNSMGTPRFRAVTLGAFALLAAILASLGVYAVRAQAVAGRRRGLGIRIALGATRRRVFQLVMLQGLYQVTLGLAIGLGAAQALAQQIEPWLFATRTTDPLIVSGALVLLLIAALVASWGPAHRASSVDPLTTLRQD